MEETTTTIEGLNLELKTIPLDDIVPDPNNPRVHTDENVNEIAESIKTLGFNNPLQVVPTDDGKYKIVAGHGRYLALQKLGAVKAPCAVLAHLEGDDARAMAANIADNEIALHSFYDEEKLAMALNALQAMSEELVAASGIDTDRFLDIAYGNALTEEDAFELNDTTVKDFKLDVNSGEPNKFDNFADSELRAGDVFVIGDAGHRLIYADATKAENMEKLMDGESAEVLVTEVALPNKGQKREAYQRDVTEMLGIANNILNADKGGVFYVMYNNDVTLEVLNAIHDAGMYRQQNLIWMMNNLSVSGHYDYRVLHENVAYGVSDTDYEAIMHQDIAYGYTDRKLKSWNNDKRQPTVIQIDANSTTKPLKLVGYFIKNHTKARANILDLLAGNGTELIACEQLHRRYFGVDNDRDAILTTLCRFAQDTHYKQPIINERTGEDITQKLHDLVKK